MDRAAGRRFNYSDLRLPPVFDSLLADFWEIEQSRQVPMEAPQPFSYAEIKAWGELTGTTFSRWQLAAIMAMDVARRDALFETRPVYDENGLQVKRTVSFQDVDAMESLFDSFGTVVDD